MGGGSDDEVTAMINDHYAGLLDIAEYWQVGDMRTVSISAIAAGTTNEAQPSQDVQLVIIGMNHDDKADGTGKAIVTVQTKNMLNTAGYMNSIDDVNYSLWANTQRRTWCNNDFKSALPTWLQSLIKPVTKVSNRFCHSSYSKYASIRGQTTTTDEVFLLSEFEVFGGQHLSSSYNGAPGSDGKIYKYMQSQSNRLKSGVSYWYTRSSLVNGADMVYFIGVYSADDGSACVRNTDNRSETGIAPAFCL